jgi:hypothetical protein
MELTWTLVKIRTCPFGSGMIQHMLDRNGKYFFNGHGDEEDRRAYLWKHTGV